MSDERTMKEIYDGKLTRLAYLSQLLGYYMQTKTDLARQVKLQKEIFKLTDAEFTAGEPQEHITPTAPIGLVK